MPIESFHVYGPTQIEWGGSILGQSDGNALVTVSFRHPHRPITTDAAGGEPEDFIQQQPHAIVVLSLIDWDRALADQILAAITDSSVQGTPAFAAVGNVGDVGMLRIADGGYKSLVVRGSKKTAANGGDVLTFPRAFRAPDSDVDLREIGNAAGILSVTLRCHPNGSGQVYTRADIS